MTYKKLSEKVKKLLDNTENKMNDLIEKYNESNEEEIDVVDLSMQFDNLKDYIEDYSQ
jgi:gas vesicle protein